MGGGGGGGGGVSTEIFEINLLQTRFVYIEISKSPECFLNFAGR